MTNLAIKEAPDCRHIHYDSFIPETIRRFHQSDGRIRCIVGSLGSGKTSAAVVEICENIPRYAREYYGIRHTKWVVVRNTYRELMDTTVKTIMDPEEGWFPGYRYKAKDETYVIHQHGLTVTLLFRACDRPQDVSKFRSLNVTGYLIDESIEVDEAIKKTLKGRIGRFPQKSPLAFGIEITNPPDVEHPTFSQFDWGTENPPPGALPRGTPLKGHVGFWQPPFENEPNLPRGYYPNLINDYANDPDWLDMYVYGKPGKVIRGKLVYNNFDRKYHVSRAPLAWAKGVLYRGWDNSGNIPACVVVQMPQPRTVQVLAEFHTAKENIADFCDRVVFECGERFPNAGYVDWGDPAGENEYSTRRSITTRTGFTSNAQIMREDCGIDVKPSEQNFTARVAAVEKALAWRDGLLIDPSCVRLINGFLSGYSYSEARPGIYGEKPIKNLYSHPHDALQYVLVKLVSGAGAEEEEGLTAEGVRQMQEKHNLGRV